MIDKIPLEISEEEAIEEMIVHGMSISTMDNNGTMRFFSIEDFYVLYEAAQKSHQTTGSK